MKCDNYNCSVPATTITAVTERKPRKAATIRIIITCNGCADAATLYDPGYYIISKRTIEE